MGSALAKGFVEKKIVDKNGIIVSDLDEKKLEKISKIGVKTTKNNKEVVKNSEIIFLAVEPSDIDKVLNPLKIGKEKLIISIAAGVPISQVENHIEARVVRVMPNICVDVSEMASAYSLGKKTDENDRKIVEEILGQLGETVEVEEDLMDVVTGLSGSGPAYVFMIIQALVKGGEELGLSQSDARKLAAQTLKGGSEFVLDSEASLDELIDSVCTPDGTTVEGVKVLRNGNVQKTLEKAVKAATEKSKELSK